MLIHNLFFGGFFMNNSNDSFILFKCTSCGFEENIPKEVVDFFDLMDGGDPLVPPRFDCQMCTGKLYPTYYVNHDGVIYKS